MADQDKANVVPPMPDKGTIVSEQALYLSQISLYRNSLAFGGMKDPTAIWSTMVYNHPQAMLLYRELEDKDEDVANCLDTLRLKVLERDHDLTPGDETQLGLDVADFVKDQLACIPDFHSVLDCILDAPGYGFSVQEMVFDTSMGQAGLVNINDCPQELFLFGDRYQPQIGPLQFLQQPWASSGEIVPEEKFLVFTYRMRGRNRMGRPLLKSVFWPSWFKRNLQRLWLQFAEKGPGTAVVYYNDADNVAERQRAAQIAQAIVENTAIAVPIGLKVELELLKTARSQQPDTYEKFFQAMQYSIARKILGETLSSFGGESGKGTQALGNVHADTLDSRVVELCRAAASVINRSLVRPLVLWNYGPKAPMPTWGFNLGEEDDLSKRVTIDSALQKMGKLFTAGYVADKYDVPLAADEDPAAALVPAGGAAPQSPDSEEDPDAETGDDDPGAGQGAEFVEGSAEAQAHREMKELDDLFAGLKADARGVFKKRIGEVAAAVVPVERT